MSHTLCLVAKRAFFDDAQVTATEASVRACLRAFGDIGTEVVLSADRKVLFITALRDGKRILGRDARIFVRSPNGTLGWNGYWHDGSYPRSEDLLQGLEQAQDPSDVVAGLSGVFNLFFYDETRMRFWAWNTVSCMPPLFWAENDEVIAVSNRQDLLLLSMNEERPNYRPAALVSFIGSDHFTFGDTGPLGLHTLDPGQCISIEAGRLRVTNYTDDWATYGEGRNPLSEQALDELAHALIEAARASAGLTPFAFVGLSGGKDSRVVASALCAAGIETVGHTRGWEDHPDVLVAERLAGALDIPINKRVYRVDESLKRHRYDVNQYFARCISGQDGHGLSRPTQPIEVVLNQDVVPIVERVATYSGIGGEILRGGYALPEMNWLPRNAELTRNTIAEVFKHRLVANPETCRADALQALWQEVDAFFDTYFNPEIPAAILERLYLYTLFRTRFAPSCGPDVTAILADVGFIRCGMKLTTDVRASEIIQYELVKRLAPPAAALPTARYRWTFENSGPVPGHEEGWEDREAIPLVWGSRTANYPYYFAGTDFNTAMRAAILKPENCERLSTVLDIGALRDVMDGSQRFKERTSQFMWNVLAAGRLLDGAWLHWARLPVEQIPMRLDVAWHRVSDELCDSVMGYAQRLAECGGEIINMGVTGAAPVDALFAELLEYAADPRPVIDLSQIADCEFSLAKGDEVPLLDGRVTCSLGGHADEAQVTIRDGSLSITRRSSSSGGAWLILSIQGLQNAFSMLRASLQVRTPRTAALNTYLYHGKDRHARVSSKVGTARQDVQVNLRCGQADAPVQLFLGVPDKAHVDYDRVQVGGILQPQRVTDTAVLASWALSVAEASLHLSDDLRDIQRKYEVPADEYAAFLQGAVLDEASSITLHSVFLETAALRAPLREALSHSRTLGEATHSLAETLVTAAYGAVEARAPRPLPTHRLAEAAMITVPALPLSKERALYAHGDEFAPGWRVVAPAGKQVALSIGLAPPLMYGDGGWDSKMCQGASAHLWEATPNAEGAQGDLMAMPAVAANRQACSNSSIKVEVPEDFERGAWLAVALGKVGSALGRDISVEFEAAPQEDAVGKLYIPIIATDGKRHFDINSCFNINHGRKLYRLTATVEPSEGIDADADLEVWFPLGAKKVCWDYRIVRISVN